MQGRTVVAQLRRSQLQIALTVYNSASDDTHVISHACPFAACSGSAVISFLRCFLSFIIFFSVLGLVISWTFVFLRWPSAFRALASLRCCRARCNQAQIISKACETARKLIHANWRMQTCTLCRPVAQAAEDMYICLQDAGLLRGTQNLSSSLLQHAKACHITLHKRCKTTEVQCFTFVKQVFQSSSLWLQVAETDRLDLIFAQSDGTCGIL